MACTSMVTGRHPWTLIHTSVLLLTLLLCTASEAQIDRARDLVNPFIGTGGHGHTFPGPCMPNGMVQLSPDTRPDGNNDWDGCSGYHYSDSLIYGFSHTHLSGTGVADLCDVLLMPMSNGWSHDPAQYRSTFRKTTERAHAGYYTVHLDKPDVTVELTATPRVGVHRYRFPAGKEAHLVIDLAHRDHVENSSIVIVNDREVAGERRSSSWARDQRLFYCMRFSHPMRTQQAANVLAEQIAQYSSIKDHFVFGDLKGEPLVVKVGISAVSMEGARANLDAEMPHWDFDQVRKAAEEAWNAKLGKIDVSGGTREQQRIFYTALYHCYIAPYLFSDVDGHYRGMDGQVHQADHPVHTVFSLWDTFRALHPLMTILEPELTSDWIKTFLLHYEQGGRLPVWELWGNETDCMIGYHSASVIADAYLKGIRQFDGGEALEAMIASAEQDHFGLGAYRRRGYISSEDAPESVSRTLEYAYDDWCIEQMAQAIGRMEVAAEFQERSRNWQNLLDPASKFFRARRNGGFVEPFDPYEVNFHYTEANAWQYALFVPHDMQAYIGMLGGRDSLRTRLRSVFQARSRTTGRDQADITGLIGQYAHGNEPSHHMAYLYAEALSPWDLQRTVHEIMDSQYHDSPDGLSGNEDCGQMSAWLVFSAMGFYPDLPGSPSYTLGSGWFDTVRITTAPGRTFTITGRTIDGPFVVEHRLNGDLLPSNGHILHADLLSGDTLYQRRALWDEAHMLQVVSAMPQDIIAIPPVPIIQAPSPAFRDSVVVSVTAIPGPWRIIVSASHDDPNERPEPKVADGRVVLYGSGTITAFSLGDDGQRGKAVVAHFSRMDDERLVTLESTYAPQYAAGGPQAMVDGLRGGTDFRSGEWQGFQGQDVLATIDLGKPMRIERIGLGVLQDQKSWIWYPSEVEFAVSTNLRQWSSITATHQVGRDQEGTMTLDLWTPLIQKKARYVKVIARNAGPCPEWHPSAGGSSWIFIDEFLLETE